MARQFEGKVAIVTGGASGIGQALCAELCRCGAQVVVADIDFARAEQVAAKLCDDHGQARAAQLDVSDREGVQRVVSETVTVFGRLDYMFNNAAASWSRQETRDRPIHAWDQAINVNLYGVLYGTMAAYEVMARQGFGHIVNTSSIAGLIGYPTCIHYSATKAAIVNLSYSLRFEAEGLGVQVSVVCPGPVHGKSRYFFKMIGPDGAARRILDGVRRKRAIIVFPWVARVLWLLYRISPRLLLPFGRKLVANHRRSNNPTPSSRAHSIQFPAAAPNHPRAFPTPVDSAFVAT